MENQGPEDKTWWDTAKEWGKPAVSGLISGATTGAVTGSLVPGVGTMVGATVGAVSGLGGGLLGHYADKQVENKTGQSLSSRMAPEGFNDATGGALPLLTGALAAPLAVGAMAYYGSQSDGPTASPNVTPTVPDVTPTVPDVTPTVPDVTPTVPDVVPTVPDVVPTVPPSTNGLGVMGASNNVAQVLGGQAELIEKLGGSAVTPGLGSVLGGVQKGVQALDMGVTIANQMDKSLPEALVNVGAKATTMGATAMVPGLGLPLTAYDVVASTTGLPTSDQALANLTVNAGKTVAENTPEFLASLG